MFFNCKIKEIQGRDKGRQYENKGIYNNICFAMNESGEKKWNMKQTPPPTVISAKRISLFLLCHSTGNINGIVSTRPLKSSFVILKDIIQ